MYIYLHFDWVCTKELGNKCVKMLDMMDKISGNLDPGTSASFKYLNQLNNKNIHVFPFSYSSSQQMIQILSLRATYSVVVMLISSHSSFVPQSR